MNTRAALAVILFVAVALLPKDDAEITGKMPVRPTGETPVLLRRGPSPRDLPDDCAIIASEAASRLAATGAWTRIVHVTLLIRCSGEIVGHAICIWQPPTCSHVFVYDEYMIGGAVDTGTASHDLKKIVIGLSRLTHIPVLEAHFIS